MKAWKWDADMNFQTLPSVPICNPDLVPYLQPAFPDPVSREPPSISGGIQTKSVCCAQNLCTMCCGHKDFHLLLLFLFLHPQFDLYTCRGSTPSSSDPAGTMAGPL